MRSVAEEDFHDLRCPEFARPRILFAGVFYARGDAFLDVVLGEDAQAFETDFVGEHLAAGSRLHDRLVDGGQERLDLVEGKVPIDGTHAAAGPSIFILEASSHGLVERRAIHALQRPTQHALPVEEGESQVALLHAARVLGRVHVRHDLEKLGHRVRCGLSDGCECVRGLDAEPEVFVQQGLPEGLDGGGAPSAEEGQRLAGAVAGVEVGRSLHLDQGRDGDILPAAQGHGCPLAHDGRPALKAFHELRNAQPVVEAVAVLVVPTAAVED